MNFLSLHTLFPPKSSAFSCVCCAVVCQMRCTQPVPFLNVTGFVRNIGTAGNRSHATLKCDLYFHNRFCRIRTIAADRLGMRKFNFTKNANLNGPCEIKTLFSYYPVAQKLKFYFEYFDGDNIYRRLAQTLFTYNVVQREREESLFFLENNFIVPAVFVPFAKNFRC